MATCEKDEEATSVTEVVTGVLAKKTKKPISTECGNSEQEERHT